MIEFKKTTVTVALALMALSMPAQTTDNAKMKQYIDQLMSRMTLREKIGQLNLPVTGDIVTGEAKSSDLAGKISRGEVGGLFNLKGVDKIREERVGAA